MSISRRNFMTQAPLLPVLGGMCSGNAPTEERTHESPFRLVLLLDGGFDALSALIPVRSQLYYRLRPTTAVPRSHASMLCDKWALHRSMKNILNSWKQGLLDAELVVGETEESHVQAMKRRWPSMRTEDAGEGRETLLLSRIDSSARCCSFESWIPLPASMALSTAEGAAQFAKLADSTRFRCVIVALGDFDWHCDAAPRTEKSLQLIDSFAGAVLKRWRETSREENCELVIATELGRRMAENRRGGFEHGPLRLTLRLSNAGCGLLVGEDVEALVLEGESLGKYAAGAAASLGG